MSDFEKWYDKYWEENNTFPSADEAWNHQQKKIDMQECVATEIQMILNDNVYSYAEKIERIQELLK